MKILLVFVAILFPITTLSAQAFNRADTLRGSLSSYRDYDVYYYDLSVKVWPDSQFISGYSQIHFTLPESRRKIQVDLYDNMIVDSIIWQGQQLTFERELNVIWIQFEVKGLSPGNHAIQVFFHGHPQVASQPPWDGGFVWSMDSISSQPWIGVACEGAGASLWWPNKDHLSDEPDSMTVTGIVPENLVCVSNGQLVDVYMESEGWNAYVHKISYPINNYNVTLNIAPYAYFSDYYVHKSDTLKLNYYVLPHNKKKAAAHFEQVKGMLDCFYKYFAPYPFIKDGYKLVETPYWGMEHQSAVAYGNNYQNNPFGFDFIIIHESAHEYWGNSVSIQDHGQMWIHEAFATYSEALYLECRFDKEVAMEYLENQKTFIRNQMALEQPSGVNFTDWPDADMYYKGTWMLHTIRHIIDDDQKWFNILQGLYQTFALSVVNSDSIITYIDEHTVADLKPVFRQFLTEANPPVLQYNYKSVSSKKKLYFRWHNVVHDFQMPVSFQVGENIYRIKPTHNWQNGWLNADAEIQWNTNLFYFIPEVYDPE